MLRKALVHEGEKSKRGFMDVVRANIRAVGVMEEDTKISKWKQKIHCGNL